ncbi:MAG: exo-alpha-sialidase [Ruminococcaceae bacterium]|nr:exo-alpha-sialidase [Oscillospiraceae bacterium]
MKIEKIKVKDADERGIAHLYHKKYAEPEGLTLIETHKVQGTSDFYDASERRISYDNGRTWGEWEETYKEDFQAYGDHERLTERMCEAWNPVHRHHVRIEMDRVFCDGHLKAYEKFWGGAKEPPFTDHTYVVVVREDKTENRTMVKYEEGEDFDPNDPLKESYFKRNFAGITTSIIVDENGDIFFPVCVSMNSCCKILGLDVNTYFPVMPYFSSGVIVFRGVWNGERYDITYSKPIVISDRFSSRGLMEPSIAKLKSGRILVVFRGSNAANPVWNTRIDPGMPGFKWYAFSEDNGETFSDPFPWHYDTGEVIYSSSTVSRLFRDEFTGKLYWIGNITGPNSIANFPRYPLNIFEVDETYGYAIRSSMMEIDTKHDDEADGVQLSNFGIYQDRETHKIHITLTKLGQLPKWEDVYKSESWEYIIDPE